MALLQSDWAVGRKQAPVSAESGGAVVEKYEFTINDDVAIGDKIELGVLPAYHHVVDAVLIVGAMGASVTANVGIMSGGYGVVDASRTVGDELYAAADVSAAAVVRMTNADGFLLAPNGTDRGIGVEIAGANVTASGQKVTLVLTTAQ